MRNPGPVILLAVLAATAGGAAPALSAAPLSRGTIEITPALGFSHERFASGGRGESTFTTLTADGALGYCLSDRIEVTGSLLVHHQAFSEPGTGSVSETAIGFAGGVQYNFATGGRLVPFARSALGVVYNASDAPGTQPTYIAPILQAGLRLLVGPSASINYGLGYRRQANARGRADLSADTFLLEIGLSVFPRVGP